MRFVLVAILAFFPVQASAADFAHMSKGPRARITSISRIAGKGDMVVKPDAEDLNPGCLAHDISDIARMNPAGATRPTIGLARPVDYHVAGVR